MRRRSYVRAYDRMRRRRVSRTDGYDLRPEAHRASDRTAGDCDLFRIRAVLFDPARSRGVAIGALQGEKIAYLTMRKKQKTHA